MSGIPKKQHYKICFFLTVSKLVKWFSGNALGFKLSGLGFKSPRSQMFFSCIYYSYTGVLRCNDVHIIFFTHGRGDSTETQASLAPIFSDYTQNSGIYTNNRQNCRLINYNYSFIDDSSRNITEVVRSRMNFLRIVGFNSYCFYSLKLAPSI